MGKERLFYLDFVRALAAILIIMTHYNAVFLLADPQINSCYIWKEFPFNVYETTLAMYEILKSGGLTGGFNFDAKNRRSSYTAQDMFHAYILGMDAFALGLIKAVKIIEEGTVDKFIADRYSSFNGGIGRKIRSGEASLEELSDYACNMKKPQLPSSGRQEYLEYIVNNALFGE